MRLELESSFSILFDTSAASENLIFFGNGLKKSWARIVEAVLGPRCLEFVSFHGSNHPQDALYMGGAGSDNYKNFFLCHLSRKTILN